MSGKGVNDQDFQEAGNITDLHLGMLYGHVYFIQLHCPAQLQSMHFIVGAMLKFKSDTRSIKGKTGREKKKENQTSITTCSAFKNHKKFSAF